MGDWTIFSGRPTAPSSEAVPAVVPCHHPNHHPNHRAPQRPSATTPVPTLGAVVGHPHRKAAGVLSPSGIPRAGQPCSPPQ
jgi:hypothetical protein